MDFSEKLLKERKKNGFSQEQLASLLHVSRQSVSKWESGQSLPEVDKIVLLSDVFDVTTDYLLKDSIEEMEKPISQPVHTETVPHVKKKITVLKVGYTTALLGFIGIFILWVFSIADPPYSFEMDLSIARAFRFYLVYNEIEPVFWLFAIFLIVGLAVISYALLKKRAAAKPPQKEGTSSNSKAAATNKRNG